MAQARGRLRSWSVIPSRDRSDQAIDQGHWVSESLSALGKPFGGAAAFPKGKGVWRDDTQGGVLLFDEPVVIQCYTSEEAIERHVPKLREFLHRMGREAKQGAIGLVIDREYLEIGFPLDEPPQERRGKGKKRGGKLDGQEHQADRRSARAQVVGQVPNTGGGAFGAARLARIVESMQARLVPGQGLRPGRPTDASWVRHPKVPMSDATGNRLKLLAEQASAGGRKVSPMQIAAQILEEALAGIPEH